MRSRYTIVESEGVYFLTATIVNWLPVLLGEAACTLVLDALLFCRQNKSLRLYAYVITENHLHLVAEAPELSRCMQSFKQYTARGLLNLAQTTGKEWQLHQFDYCKKAYKSNSQYQAWQEGSHPQLIQGDAMLRQKIVYIHNNPVRRGMWSCRSIGGIHRHGIMNWTTRPFWRSNRCRGPEMTREGEKWNFKRECVPK